MFSYKCLINVDDYGFLKINLHLNFVEEDVLVMYYFYFTHSPR